MAKEFYDISYKTYFNTRIKEVLFQGVETWPLYVQMTYDRKSIFFKSYYFDLFSQPKYDFLRMPLSQVEELERRVLDFIIAEGGTNFNLTMASVKYKNYCLDVLDLCEPKFKSWLVSYFKEENLAGLAAMVEQAKDRVVGIHLWDDLKKTMDAGSFLRMEKRAMSFGGSYLPLATYIIRQYPKGPFCLPIHEWYENKNRKKMESAMGESFQWVSMTQISHAADTEYAKKNLLAGVLKPGDKKLL